MRFPGRQSVPLHRFFKDAAFATLLYLGGRILPDAEIQRGRLHPYARGKPQSVQPAEALASGQQQDGGRTNRRADGTGTPADAAGLCSRSIRRPLRAGGFRTGCQQTLLIRQRRLV